MPRRLELLLLGLVLLAAFLIRVCELGSFPDSVLADEADNAQDSIRILYGQPALAPRVTAAPAVTAIFPWVAANNGTVDVVYYGTSAASKDDENAVWNVYLAQTTDGGASFAQSKFSNTSNHVGEICTEGTACAPGSRNLLDLCEVSINPQNGRAAIIYTDDTQATDPDGNPLPQIVLAQQQ